MIKIFKNHVDFGTYEVYNVSPIMPLNNGELI